MSYQEIEKLTYVQYMDLLDMIQTKQIWDLQNHTVALSGEFDEDVNPLYALGNEDKKMTMEDAQALLSMSKQQGG